MSNIFDNYTEIKIELKTGYYQFIDNKEEDIKRTKQEIEEINKNAIKNDENLKPLFFDCKPKVKVKIEEINDSNRNKRRRGFILLEERKKINE